MNTDEYEGIIVLGSPRSGTTLVRRLLNAHPRLSCPPETNLLNACGRLLRTDTITGGVTLGIVSGLSYCGFSEKEVYGRLREFVFGFFREICAKAGKDRWVEKSPFDVFHLDQVEKICGETCRYLCLFRHPLDVIYSTKEWFDIAEVYPMPYHEYIKQWPAPYEAIANAWVDCNRRLRQFADDHPKSATTLKYEDLVSDPHKELSRVLTFFGEGIDVAPMIQEAFKKKDTVGLSDWKTYKTQQINKGSVGRWKSLPEETIARLAKIVNPLMEPLGYDALNDTTMEPDRAHHLYQILLGVSRLKTEVNSSSKGEKKDD